MECIGYLSLVYKSMNVISAAKPMVLKVKKAFHEGQYIQQLKFDGIE